MSRFLIAVITIAAVFNFLYNSAPPTGEDELVYHVSLPAQYLAAGHIVETPTNPNGYFPMNGELITTVMMWLGGWRLAKAFVWLSGLLMTWALYCFGRRHAGLTVESSLWAAAILYTMPCITSLNGTVSVDQLNLLFEILAVYFIFEWNISLAGLFAGLSLGTRPYSIAWVVAAVFCLIQTREEFWVFVLIAAVFVIPYPIRNWWLTGNPFYPRAFWPHAAQDVYFRAIEAQYMPHGLTHYFTLPFWLSFGGLIWGCGPIPATMIWESWGENRDILIFAEAILFWTALIPMTMFNARYFSPLFPWLAILAAKGLEQ